MKKSLNEWKANNNILLILTNKHDQDFRKKHICKCKNQVDYGNGETYCEAMQKSRMKNQEIKNIIFDDIKNSPFLPNQIKSIEHMSKIF